jgi:hypothetical protein
VCTRLRHVAMHLLLQGYISVDISNTMVYLLDDDMNTASTRIVV